MLLEQGKKWDILQKLYPMEYKSLFVFLQEHAEDMGPQSAELIFKYLISGEKEVSQTLLTELQGFVVESPGKLITDLRAVAREMMQKPEVQEMLKTLGAEGASVYGSLQYGDWVNADLDLTITLQDALPMDDFFVDSFQWFNFYIEKNWPTRQGHVTLFAIRGLTDASLEDIYSYASECGEILTGRSILNDDTQWLERRKKIISTQARSNPLMRAVINANLEDCLNTRKQRLNPEFLREKRQYSREIRPDFSPKDE
jgi:hypothetical protein